MKKKINQKKIIKMRVWTVVSPSGKIWPQYSWGTKVEVEDDLKAHYWYWINGTSGLTGALYNGYKIKRATITIV